MSYNETRTYMPTIKTVVVGDGCVGKTCLLVSYCDNCFPEEHVPTVFDNKSTVVLFDGKPVNLNIWDTAGQEDYARLRPLSYPSSDAFLVVFSITSRNSFNNVTAKWLPELAHHAPGVPFVLVGTKKDLRDDPASLAHCEKMGKPMVTKEEAEKMAKKLGAYGYVECSALYMEGITDVFDTALRAAKKGSVPKKRNKCTFL